MTNNPKHKNVGRQIWGEFNFSDHLWGAMKICLDDHGLYTYSWPRTGPLRDFEKNCVLAPGRWPGPSPDGFQKCLMRLRGTKESYYLPRRGIRQTDDYETELIFGVDEEGKLTLSIVMIVDSQYFVRRGTKLRAKEPYKSTDATIRTRWDHFRPPVVPRAYAYLFK
jgi:hypothetical protein